MWTHSRWLPVDPEPLSQVHSDLFWFQEAKQTNLTFQIRTGRHPKLYCFPRYRDVNRSCVVISGRSGKPTPSILQEALSASAALCASNRIEEREPTPETTDVWVRSP
jgi:hypothetical protein